MKKIFINSFDLSIGGVERSLINMLNSFDYKKYKIDLMLYKNRGELINLLSEKVNLLPENRSYSTFGMTIKDLISQKEFRLAFCRIIAKIISKSKFKKETGYYQDQIVKKISSKYLDNIETEYDIAISYIWPHNIVANKVRAKKKIAWIHTDYSQIFINRELDLNEWNKFDNIIAISQKCMETFIEIYPDLKEKVSIIENITSPRFIKKMSEEKIEENIFNEEYFNLVSVGRLCYSKNFDNAVKVLKVLHNRGMKNIRWYVIGEGMEEYKIKKLIRENGLENSFILLGKKTNPYPYMKKANLYVQPSRYEGKAVTVVEAQILEKTVLISNYETAKSQVNNNIDGYIVEGSIKGLATGIQEIYSNRELIKNIVYNLQKINYSNYDELEKLYRILES